MNKINIREGLGETLYVIDVVWIKSLFIVTVETLYKL